MSNPPYIPTGQIDSLEPEVRDFEPRAALDGGTDGQDFFRRIAGEAGNFLKPNGCVMVELDADGSEGARRIFEEKSWRVEPIEADLQRRPRFLIARPASTGQ